MKHLAWITVIKRRPGDWAELVINKKSEMTPEEFDEECELIKSQYGFKPYGYFLRWYY